MKNTGIQICRVNSKSQEAGSVLSGYTSPSVTNGLFTTTKKSVGLVLKLSLSVPSRVPKHSHQLLSDFSYFILFFLVHIFLLNVIDYKYPQYQIS